MKQSPVPRPPTGSTVTTGIDQAVAQRFFELLLQGPESFVEVRRRRSRGRYQAKKTWVDQRYFSAGEHDAAAAWTHGITGGGRETWVTMRDARAGAPGTAVRVRSPNAHGKLAFFPLPPTLVVTVRTRHETYAVWVHPQPQVWWPLESTAKAIAAAVNGDVVDRVPVPGTAWPSRTGWNFADLVEVGQTCISGQDLDHRARALPCGDSHASARHPSAGRCS